MTAEGRPSAHARHGRTRMTREEVVAWLLEGDVAIQHQVHRDLLGRERPDLQRRIAREGWGAQYLAARNADGSWGLGFYQPKWTCSHYTLLDLAAFGMSPDTPGIREEIERCAQEELGSDGGINPAGSVAQSDVCINGTFLTYACHFGVPEERLATVVDFVLAQTMDDGGFNCRRNRSGARHSSVHSTICVLEGAWAYARRGYRYRAGELAQAVASSRVHVVLERAGTPSRWITLMALRVLDRYGAAVDLGA